jgi:hypothetical protein
VSEHFSDAQLTDFAAAEKEYHASRARYIRTVTTDTEKQLMETVAKRRDPIKEELGNLTALAKVRLIGGIDKLYKAAVKAAEDFNEVNDIIKKRKDRLEAIDSEVRTVLEQHGRDLIAQLETPAGLEGAFKRDPLLARAHARMTAAAARREVPS